MKEYWQRTTVCGNDEEMGRIREIVLHRRGEDPMVMAFRRNHALAGCGRIRMETEEIFQLEKADLPAVAAKTIRRRRILLRAIMKTRKRNGTGDFNAALTQSCVRTALELRWNRGVLRNERSDYSVQR